MTQRAAGPFASDSIRVGARSKRLDRISWRTSVNYTRITTRTPADWMSLDASDEQQLPGAAAQGCAIFTYNIRGFLVLGKRYPHHGAIIHAFQKSMKLNETIHALDRLLREADALEWIGQTQWLNDWKR